MSIGYKSSIGEWGFDILIAIVMITVTVTCLYPFIYILFYSLSSSGQVGTGLLLYPKGFTFDSYNLMFTSVKEILHALLISVLRSTIEPVLAVLVTSLGSYALTRRDLLFRGFWTRYITITMYFSCGMIPVYMLMYNLKLVGTFWIYIIPSLFSAFNMLLIKTYMETLPPSLQESAVIDGANDFIQLFRIVLPLCKPVLAAILLFECVGQWNAYSDNMIYNSNKSNLHTLQYVLMNFIQSNSSSVEDARLKAKLITINSTSLKMSLTVITVIPIMFVYPFLQKYFAKGILIGSIKG